MRIWVLVFLLVGMVWLTGCSSSVSVNHDYDTDADFTQYKTYTWAPVATSPTGKASTGKANSLLDRRIRNAVDQQLTDKRLQPDPDDPDLLVVYHLGVKDKVQVTDWGYSYSSHYWGMGTRDIDVYQYQEGTLIIDLVDTQSKTLVWRGSGTKVLESNRTTEQVEKTLNDAVAKILSQYPPRR